MHPSKVHRPSRGIQSLSLTDDSTYSIILKLFFEWSRENQLNLIRVCVQSNLLVFHSDISYDFDRIQTTRKFISKLLNGSNHSCGTQSGPRVTGGVPLVCAQRMVLILLRFLVGELAVHTSDQISILKIRLLWWILLSRHK